MTDDEVIKRRATVLLTGDEILEQAEERSVPTLKELIDNQRRLVARVQEKVPPAFYDGEHTKALAVAIDKLATLETLAAAVPRKEATQ